MTFRSGVALLLPALAVYLACRWIWPRDETRLSRGLAAAIAPGLGIGFSSVVYFGLFLITSHRQTLTLLDAGAWVAVDGCLLLAVMRRKGSTAGPGPVRPLSFPDCILGATLQVGPPEAPAPPRRGIRS